MLTFSNHETIKGGTYDEFFLFTRRVPFMKPHYYIMKNKKILRLEDEVSFSSLPDSVKNNVFDAEEIIPLDQDQANWRVAIFRDEILDQAEYTEWLESNDQEEANSDLIAN